MNRIKSLFFFFSLLAGAATLIAGNAAHADTVIDGGNVINQTWTAAGSPYVVRGDITVPVGGFLHIEAGTTVQFPSGDLQQSGTEVSRTEINIHGELHVSGTASDPIVFQGQTGTIRQWQGIKLLSTSSAVIHHAVVENASNGIHIESADLGLHDVEVSDGDIGISIHNGNPTLDRVVLRKQGTGIGVYGGNADINNCLVHDNTTGVLVNPTAGSTVRVVHCTVVNNNTGVRNKSTDADVQVRNSIITGNINGLWFSINSSNSNVWGNVTDYVATGHVTTDNISANPQFVSSTDFHLQSTSVCIDAGAPEPTLGSDLESTFRPLNGDGLNSAEYDMGAYEYSGTGTGPVPEDWTGLSESDVAAADEEVRYSTPVLGKGQYKFALSGSNDADLYVRVGSAPTTEVYDCRPYLNGTNEECTIDLSADAQIHLMVRGYGKDAAAFTLIGHDTACPSTGCSDEVVRTYPGNAAPIAIPDNTPAGISNAIVISDAGVIGSMQIALNITHTYQGDLRVVLRRGQQSIVLHDRTGAGTDNLVLDVALGAFAGSALAGEYVLEVSDSAGADVGTLDSWQLTATLQ